MSSTHNDERFDARTRAYLAWEAGQITDAPSRAEMARRIAGSSGRAGTSTWRMHAATVPLLLAVALLLAAMVGLVLGRLLFDPLPQQRIVFTRSTADGTEIAVMDPDGTGSRTLVSQPAAGEARNPRWSPDGARVSWTADDGIHVVDADGTNARLLAPEASRYDWSPDSRQIVAGDSDYPPETGELRLVDVATGDVVRAIEAADRGGGAYAPAWSPDGTSIAFVRTLNSANAWVSIVRADGTELRQLLRIRSVQGHHYHVSWSPDGTSIAFTARSLLFEEMPTEGTYLMSATGTDANRVADFWSASSWSPDGTQLALASSSPSVYGLYVGGPDGSDVRRISLANAPDAFNPQEHSLVGYNPRAASWSADGQNILFDREGELIVVRADGSGERSLGHGQDPAWSPVPQEPSNERILFARRTSDGFEIAAADAQGSEPELLVGQSEAGTAYAPTWSPDGTRIAWAADDGIHITKSDGTDSRLLVEGRHSYGWSPDGTRLVIGDVYPWPGGAFSIVDAEDGRLIRELPPVAAAYAPAWSPNGTLIAFVRGGPRMASATLCVIAPDGTDIVPLSAEVSVQSHRYALAWSPDGRSIAFTAGEATNLLNVGPGGGSDRQRLLDAWAAVSWSPDGSEFAYVRPNDGGGTGLYVMRADGTDERLLSSRADAPLRSALGSVARPGWSPDGTEIVFVRNGDILIIGADGSRERSVARGLDPAWAPAVD